MGYDLKPKNPAKTWFHFGAFSFPVLLQQCGLLWPVMHSGSQWFCAFGVDPRMPQGDDYPRLLSNDGFPVTEAEAKIMARMARNYAAVQALLPEENRGSGTRSVESITAGDVGCRIARELLRDNPTGTGWPEDLIPALAELLLKSERAYPLVEPWPEKVRDDFVEKIRAFADWAEESGGFEIH